MNDIIFYKNFCFNEFSFNETRRSDNTHGIEYHFIGFIKKGRGRITYEGGTLEINEGEMFYIPKGLKYNSCWIAEDKVVFDSIGFLYFPSNTTNGYKLQKINHDKELYGAFYPLSINKEINNASIGALYTLLYKLESVLELAPNSKADETSEKLVLLMKENAQKTIPEYARILGFSEALLYSYVKKSTGKTPNRIRQEILSEKALTLLTTTNLTIEQICDRLGFSSSAYFRKVFFSVYKKSPTCARKENKMI